MSKFRIIGIRILEGCDHRIRKVLKEKKTYFFFDGYMEADKDFVTRKTIHADESINLYDIRQQNNHDIHVEVSAIVGKNGDGKSTILEIMLRVLNNFAVAHGYGKLHESLKGIKGLAACLYYEYDGVLYTIKCLPTEQDEISNQQVKWYRGAKLVDSFSEVGQQKKLELLKMHQEELFFSLVINYSLYAYNEKTFRHENAGPTSWIQALFHKNDSYQTPINLNPMRTEGNINVNKENTLAHQRLMTMFTQAGDAAKLTQRKISENEVAIGFACSLSEESNLRSEILEGYLVEQKGTFVTWPSFSQYIGTTGEGSNPRINLINKEKLDSLLISIRTFMGWFSVKAHKYQGMLKELNERTSHYRLPKSQRSDISNYLLLIQRAIREAYKPSMSARKMGEPGWQEKMEAWESRYAELDGLLSDYLRGEYNWLNYTQLYRLYAIWSVWEAITEENIIPRDSDLNEDLKYAGTDHLAAARIYVAYKFLSIMDTYAPYSDEEVLYDKTYKLIAYLPEAGKGVIGETAVKIFKEEDDYTTLKLTQALNYLKHDILRYDKMELCVLKDVAYQKFIPFEKLYSNIVAACGIDEAKLTLHEISKLLPPPFLKGDIIIEKDGDFYGLNSLSSGETQRIFTVSSFIYHLRNLDNKQEKKIQYKNICVAFEETEQYFHPDYQRTFVKYLLDQLANAGLSEITNLHIIFVTHSPFILSDIPQSNIIYLKKGETEQIELRTFCANVNDLLHDSFFLDGGFIGEFAATKIRSLIEYLSNKNDDFTRDTAMKLINLIGEPIIRRQLTSLYKKKFDKINEDFAQWIRDKYRELEEVGQ